MKEWCDVKKDFEPEGSLRDIYIEDINESVWNLFLSDLLDSGYKICFTHGQQVVALPESFAEIKKLQETEPTTLGIAIENGIWINCHFFIESEIELDLSPKDIDTESKFKNLVGFLHWLHLALRKPVKLTHENSQTEVILYLS
ncbi:hypothetical protein [Pseudaeromonas paramecii]|uniref:Uncharacterized protein n=1 Tax=Pseudaeromonas paramecii TaxID=2138166 RepID=A0ABP8QF08_9GAMM